MTRLSRLIDVYTRGTFSHITCKLIDLHVIGPNKKALILFGNRKLLNGNMSALNRVAKVDNQINISDQIQFYYNDEKKSLINRGFNKDKVYVVLFVKKG